jgi:hypothetical protein
MNGEPVLYDPKPDTLLVDLRRGRPRRRQRSTTRSAARTSRKGWSSTTGRTGRARGETTGPRALAALRQAKGFAGVSPRQSTSPALS